jgi:hypothetical protein
LGLIGATPEQRYWITSPALRLRQQLERLVSAMTIVIDENRDGFSEMCFTEENEPA